MVFWRKLISKKDYFIERRFSGRKNCDVSVQRMYDSAWVDVTIKNISPYGLGLESEVPFKDGQIFELKADPVKEPFGKVLFKKDTISVETVWASKRRIDSKFTAGVKFIDTRTHLKDSWILSLIEQTGLRVDHKIHWRAYIRYPAFLDVHYDSLNGNFEGSGKMINISAGGIALETASTLPVHTNLNLRLGPEFGLQQVSAVGEVCWSSYLEATKTAMQGIAFQFPISENKLLYKYVETIAIMCREKKY